MVKINIKLVIEKNALFIQFIFVETLNYFIASDVYLPRCNWRLCSPIHLSKYREQHENGHL